MEKRIFIYYLIAINILATLVTIYDKFAAKHIKRRRVPEALLLFIAGLGGGPAMYISMVLIRHKTRKGKFMVGIPLIIILQALVYFRYFSHSLF